MNDLPAFLQDCLNSARRVELPPVSRGRRNRQRSSAWVEALATGFRQHMAADPTVRVFSKHDASNRADFGINELLYDVLVCRIAMVESAVNRAPLSYIERALWQVESEFERNSRAALVDMNKLVIGAAENKLFIGPQVGPREAFLDVLLPAARACTGSVHAALIPHPDRWDESTPGVEVWGLHAGTWRLSD